MKVGSVAMIDALMVEIRKRTLEPVKIRRTASWYGQCGRFRSRGDSVFFVVRSLAYQVGIEAEEVEDIVRREIIETLLEWPAERLKI